MRTGFRTPVYLVLALALICGLLVESWTVTRAAAAPTVAGCAKTGGTLVVANPEPAHLNPTLALNFNTFLPANVIYDRLLSVDYGMQVSPGLAERWTVARDGLSYTFSIAKNVKWTDGTPFSAADIKFTYDEIIRRNLPGRAYLTDVDRIEAPDAATLVIRLKAPNASFLPLLAMTGTWFTQILPRHLYDGTDWTTNPRNLEPIGTGPFVVERWVKGSFISFTANKDYFRGRPCLDRVVLRFISDAVTAQTAFRAGEVNYLVESQTPPIRELVDMEKDRRWRVITVQFWYYNGVYFNVKRPPFTDERVRRAVGMAINQDEQNEKVLLGKGVVQKSPGLDYLPGKWVNTRAQFPAFNTQQAERLLDEAGLPRKADGVRFPMRYLTFPNAQNQAMADLLKVQLARVGINLIIEEVEYPGTFLDRARRGNFDGMVYFVRYGPDPGAYNEHFATGGPRNFMGYSNPDVDRALDAGLSTVSPDSRRQFYFQVQNQLVKDLPYVHLAPSPYFFLASNNLKDFASEKEVWGKAGPWHGGFRLVQLR